MNARPAVRPGARGPLALLLGGTILLVAACASSGAAPADFGPLSGGDTKGGLPAATAAPAEAPGTGQRTTNDGSSAVSDSVLIVRTGQLELRVAKLDTALPDAEQAIVALGGYVAASARQGEGGDESATVTYRIPAARWEDALAAVRKVGEKVVREQTASQEVTAQVVDLGARLANLRATESALQAIMAKATRIPDVLAVQEQLTGVRDEIERLTAEKKNLEGQAALATLTVTFSPPPEVAVTAVQEGWDPAREVDRAAAALVGIGQAIANAAIWLAIVVLPIALGATVLALLVLLVVRRTRRAGRTGGSTGPTAAPGDAPAGA